MTEERFLELYDGLQKSILESIDLDIKIKMRDFIVRDTKEKIKAYKEILASKNPFRYLKHERENYIYIAKEMIKDPIKLKQDIRRYIKETT